MAASRKGQAVSRRGAPSTAGKSLPQPNNDTMVYMRETFALLTLPDSIDFDIPPLDLTGWQDPYEARNGSTAATDIVVDSADESFSHPARSTGQHSRASSSASEDRPIAQTVAEAKHKKSSPPSKRKQAASTKATEEEEGEISGDATPSTSALPPRPSTSKTVAKEEEQPSPKKVKSEAAGLSSHRQSNGATSPTPHESTEAAQPPPPPPHQRATYFSKNKLKLVATECRNRGRTLKRAGEARLRTKPSPLEAKLSTLEVTDAFLLYVYSFWADDLLSGRLDEHGRLTKPACLHDNWRSVSGLLKLVRVRAEATHAHIISCLVDLIEAMLLTHMQRVERRKLHTVVQHAQAHHPQTSNGHGHGQDTLSGAGAAAGTTPGSSIPTPPSDAALASAEVNRQMQDTFLELSTDSERALQLFRSAQDVLTLVGLRTHLPSLAQKIMAGTSGFAPYDQMSEPARPWTFAFGIDTNVSYAALGQVVCYGRAILEEYAVQSGVTWRPEWEPVDGPQ